MSKRLVDLELVLHHETKPDCDDEGAYLVSDDGDRDHAVWLPKCAVERCGKVFTMLEQLAIDKGLV